MARETQNLALARAVYASATCDSSKLAALDRDAVSRVVGIDKDVDKFFAPEFVAHGPAVGIRPNLAGTKRWTAALMKAFPDYYVKVEDQFGVDDKVVTRWTARGTHKDEFQGIPPTGKHIAVTGITISRYAGDKIVESWVEWDIFDMMQQLGADPFEGRRGVGGGVNITINRA